MAAETLPYGLAGRDAASTYFAWMLGLFGDALTGEVLDHGAGTGALSQLLARSASRVWALEPHPQLFAHLCERFREVPMVEPLQGDIEAYLARRGPCSLDAILSSNVLEHVPDDVECLRRLGQALRPGGVLAVYVPARAELFGSLDRSVGHLRRYSRAALANRLQQAGYFVEWVRYVNLAGVLPWWVSGRVLKRTALSGASLGLFDRWVLPLSARLEGLVPLPYGLSAAALARRQ